MAFPPHLLLALPVGDARRIPEILREGTASACNGLLGRRQGAQGRVGVEGPVAPGFTWSRAQQCPKNPPETSEDLGIYPSFIPSLNHPACEAVLEEHPDDGHHGQPSIGDLGRQLLFLGGGWGLHEAVGNAQEARIFDVTRSPLGIIHLSHHGL